MSGDSCSPCSVLLVFHPQNFPEQAVGPLSKYRSLSSAKEIRVGKGQEALWPQVGNIGIILGLAIF